MARGKPPLPRRTSLAKKLEFEDFDFENDIDAGSNTLGSLPTRNGHLKLNNYEHTLKKQEFGAGFDNDKSTSYEIFQICVFFLLISLCIILMIPEGFNLLNGLWIMTLSSLAGICCGGFSWIITYYDSLQPGTQPPTPISPSKDRRRSGHTFHSSYIMAIMNGVAAFLVTLWYLCS